jgi:hypothetical protein
MDEFEYRGAALTEPNEVVKGLLSDVRRLNIDVYFGNGKESPSLTARMKLVEDCLERITGNMRTLVFMVVGVIISALVDIVVHIATVAEHH